MPEPQPRLPAIGEEIASNGTLPPIGGEVGSASSSVAATPEAASALHRFLSPLLPSMVPGDYINGPLYVAKHPLDSIALITNAIKADPMGATPVIGNLKRAVAKIESGDYAGASGELTAAVAPMALKGVRVPVGGAVSAVGRGLETVAASPAARYSSGAGAVYEALRGQPLKAAAMAVTAPAVEATGKGLQKVGAVLAPAAESPIDRYRPNVSGDTTAPVPESPSQAIPGLSSVNTAKEHFTAREIVRIQDLMRQGVPQNMAIEAVTKLRQYATPSRYSQLAGRP